MKSSVIVFCFFNFLVLVRPAIVNKTTGHEKHQEGTRVGDITNSPRQNNLQSGNGVERSRRTLILKDENRLWPNGIIPYSIDIKECPSYQTGIRRQFCDSLMEMLRSAMEDWENKTCIKFVKRGDKSRVSITRSGKVCFSEKGYKAKKRRLILAPKCWTPRLLRHHLGHVIGLSHEHIRRDRDKYVKIDYDDIIFDKTRQFYMASKNKAKTNGLPYDYRSIMHYHDKVYAKDSNKIVIKTLDPAMQNVIGNVQHISFLDYKTVSISYKCAKRCGIDLQDSDCPDDGYVDYQGYQKCHCVCKVKDGGKFPKPCSRVRCLNGGTWDGKTFKCNCLDNFYGGKCENCRIAVPHMEKCANRWDFIIYATQKVTPASTL